MKITNKTITGNISFDPENQYIRSDLKIVKREDWNNRWPITKCYHSARKISIKSADVIEQLEKVRANVKLTPDDDNATLRMQNNVTFIKRAVENQPDESEPLAQKKQSIPFRVFHREKNFEYEPL